MTDITLYHNPRCSKSRAALTLLESQGCRPTVRLYLQDPPTLAELRHLLKALGTDTRSLLRSNEAQFLELGLDDPARSNNELLQAIARHPILLQRPIALAQDRAVIGRPPETVLELLA